MTQPFDSRLFDPAIFDTDYDARMKLARRRRRGRPNYEQWHFGPSGPHYKHGGESD